MDKFDQVMTGVFTTEVTPEMKEKMDDGGVIEVTVDDNKSFKAMNKDKFLGKIKDKVYDKMEGDKHIKEVEEAFVEVSKDPFMDSSSYVIIS